MAKNNKVTQAYGAAINKRVPIMLGLIGLLMVLFTVGFFTANYYNNKPNPLEAKEKDETVKVVYTTMEKLSEEKFTISDFYLKRFILEDADGNFYEDGQISLEIKLGNKKDENIRGSSVTVTTHLCYNWANETFSTNSQTVTFQNESTYSKNNIDATFKKRPFLFTKVDLRDDARFITTFEFTEVIGEQSQNYVYVIENTYKDLVRTGQGGTSFTK